MNSETFTTEYNNNSKNPNFDIDIWEYKEYLKNDFKFDPEKIESVSIAEAIITWDFYIEMREWGVKNVGAYATAITLNLNVEYYEDETAEPHVSQITIDVDEDKGWSIDSNRDKANDGHYSVSHLEINLETKTITITF